MSVDLWFPQDVARVLAATYEAMDGFGSTVTPSQPEHAHAYRQGFSDALRAVGVAFGVVGRGSALDRHSRLATSRLALDSGDGPDGRLGTGPGAGRHIR